MSHRSHVATDECGAPEFFGGGLKVVELPGEDGKITAETLTGVLADRFGHSPHQLVAFAIPRSPATAVSGSNKTAIVEPFRNVPAPDHEFRVRRGHSFA